MKKLLVSLGGITFILLMIINISLIEGRESIYKLKYSKIHAFSDKKKTFKSCLINQDPISGRKKSKSDISDLYCYKKQDKGADIFCGEVVECIYDSTYRGIPCIPAICNANDSVCFASKRKPVSANYLK
ncbi:MAG: hypothetical protein LBE13_04035 [Bacteroidales bacterium]|jgi:hypothetical protein|nr:hypothetical protein [Bacteroidales bacterium]